MVEERLMQDPFKTCLQMADKAFGSLAGGPKPHAVPSGLDIKAIKAICVPNDNCSVKDKVIKCILSLFEWVNDCEEEKFDHVDLQQQLLMTKAKTSGITAGTELGEFRLMLILQMCAPSSVVLRPSRKLVNLLHPISGKGSANHLHNVGVLEVDHHDALRRVSHYFELEDFGDNGGEPSV
jgi:hypothetical protein